METSEIYAIAYNLYQAGHFLHAEKAFRLLTCLETKNSHHWMGLASSLKMQKKYEDAVCAFSAAAVLSIQEENPLPHAYAAECLIALGNKERAHLALTSAKELASKKECYIPLSEQLQLLETRWFN